MEWTEHVILVWNQILTVEEETCKKCVCVCVCVGGGGGGGGGN